MRSFGINQQKVNDLLKFAKITEPPVDVEKVALLFDVRVIPWEFPDSFDGGVFIHDKGRVIAVNKNHSLTRQRFTIAHEIGHLAHGHYISDTELELFKDTSFNYLNPLHRQNHEADLFAAELLMPRQFLENNLIKMGLDYQRLAEIYQVSDKAMKIRLINTGLAEKYAIK